MSNRENYQNVKKPHSINSHDSDTATVKRYSLEGNKNKPYVVRKWNTHRHTKKKIEQEEKRKGRRQGHHGEAVPPPWGLVPLENRLGLRVAAEKKGL